MLTNEKSSVDIGICRVCISDAGEDYQSSKAVNSQITIGEDEITKKGAMSTTSEVISTAFF